MTKSLSTGDRLSWKSQGGKAEGKVVKTTGFEPTAKMAANARLGLRLRDQFGRGGTEVGVRRARQLADRRVLDPSDIKSMYSYFARHEVDRNTTRYRWGSVDDPSPGFVAWLLWGGDEGKEWVGRQRRKLADNRVG